MDELLIKVPQDIENLQLPHPTLLQFYKDLEKRIFWLDAEVDDTLIDLVRYIVYWNQEDKDKPVEDRVPIKIFINSPGGDLTICDLIIDTIRMSKTPIYAIGTGMVASAASLIYLSCHKKYLFPNAHLILHDGSAVIGGSGRDVINAVEDYKKQLEKNILFIIANTGYTEEEVRTNMKSDWYIRTPEALSKGASDGVITDISMIL